MQGLIRSAAKGIKPAQEIVQDGNYSLIGPMGEIILLQVWEMVVEPGWTVFMQERAVVEVHTEEDKGAARSPAWGEGFQATQMRSIAETLSMMRISGEDRARRMAVIIDAIQTYDDDDGW